MFKFLCYDFTKAFNICCESHFNTKLFFIHIRSNTTPYSTNTDRPSSRALVDDAPQHTTAQMSMTGTKPDYLAQVGEGQHRLELPLFTGDDSDLIPYEHSATHFNKYDIMFDLDAIDLTDTRENYNQLGCYQRLNNLYKEILGSNDIAKNHLLDSYLK